MMLDVTLCEHLKKIIEGRKMWPPAESWRQYSISRGETWAGRQPSAVRWPAHLQRQNRLIGPREIEDFVGRGASDTELMATNAVRQSEVKATVAQLSGRIPKTAAAKNGLLKSEGKTKQA